MKEAHRMGIPTICVLDTDCDPSLADIVIPANDDAMKSVGLLLSRLADAVIEGRANYAATAMITDKQKALDADEPKPRASRRPGDRPGVPGAGRAAEWAIGAEAACREAIAPAVIARRANARAVTTSTTSSATTEQCNHEQCNHEQCREAGAREGDPIEKKPDSDNAEARV